jgi:chromosome segregation ATPase
MTTETAAELEKLGKISKQAAWTSGIGLTILVGSLLFASLRLAGAQKQLTQTQNDLKTLESARDAKEQELTRLTAEVQAKQAELQAVSQTVSQSTAALGSTVDVLKKASAAPSPGQSVQVAHAIADAEQSIADLQSANQRLQHASSPSTAPNNQPLAREKYKEGFEKLAADDYDGAADAFKAADDASPGYHSAFELSRLIRSHRGDLSDPIKRKETIRKILDEYAQFAPADAVSKLKASIQ